MVMASSSVSRRYLAKHARYDRHDHHHLLRRPGAAFEADGRWRADAPKAISTATAARRTARVDA
jgi:hypothetical protein